MNMMLLNMSGKRDFIFSDVDLLQDHHEPKVKKPRPVKKAKSSTPKFSKKDLEYKLKLSTDQELRTLIKNLYNTKSEVVMHELVAYKPALMPMKPSDDDMLLTCCFHCDSKHNLTNFYDVKICGKCHEILHKDDCTLTRDEVMDFFSFSKSEADKITRTRNVASDSTVFYTYKLKSVIRSCEKKNGSVYMMLRKKRGFDGEFLSIV